MSFADYIAIDAINASLLKPHSVSARHARWKASEDQDTAALSLGRVVHTAILEAERFRDEYVVAPKVDRRTKAGKTRWAEFQAESDGRIVVTADEHQIACNIAHHTCTVPHIAELLWPEPREVELTVVQPDAHHDLLCKARIDCYREWQGWPTIIDLKTTSARDLKPHTLAREIHKYGYHIQAAWYKDLYERATGLEIGAFVFVFCQTTQDRDVAAYQLDDDSIEQGRREARKYLQQIVTCRETGRWPGVQPDSVGMIGLPIYALESTLDDTGIEEATLG
jgi:exodeoxyribonuclease VIII